LWFCPKMMYAKALDSTGRIPREWQQVESHFFRRPDGRFTAY